MLSRHENLNRLIEHIPYNPLKIIINEGFYYVVEKKTNLVVSLRPGFDKPVRKKSLKSLIHLLHKFHYNCDHATLRYKGHLEVREDLWERQGGYYRQKNLEDKEARKAKKQNQEVSIAPVSNYIPPEPKKRHRFFG